MHEVKVLSVCTFLINLKVALRLAIVVLLHSLCTSRVEHQHVVI